MFPSDLSFNYAILVDISFFFAVCRLCQQISIIRFAMLVHSVKIEYFSPKKVVFCVLEKHKSVETTIYHLKA